MGKQKATTAFSGLERYLADPASDLSNNQLPDCVSHWVESTCSNTRARRLGIQNVGFSSISHDLNGLYFSMLFYQQLIKNRSIDSIRHAHQTTAGEEAPFTITKMIELGTKVEKDVFDNSLDEVSNNNRRHRNLGLKS